MKVSVPSAAVLVVSVMGALIFGARAMRDDRPALEIGLHDQVGRALAEATAAELDEGGMVVVILPEASFDMPLVHAQYRSFRKHLPDRVRVGATEHVRLDRMGPLDGLLTPEIYRTLVDRHSGAAAFVSFVGVGEFRRADLADLGGRVVPLHVISVNTPPPAEYFKMQLVRAAVAPRRHPAPGADGTPFDQRYELLTPAALGLSTRR